jgi:hypothetical protein
MNARVATACTAIAAKKAAVMPASGATSPPWISGGMPSSMPSPTSHGPVSAATFAITISTSVQATWRRYGRSSAVSSLLARLRSRADSPEVT